MVNIADMPTTISVTEDVKEALLKVASELQIKLGRRVDLNEAIRYLLARNKRPDLLEEACKPAPGFEEAYRELVEGRRKDEERARRKYGL
jgi:predicted CopG family antitoxin